VPPVVTRAAKKKNGTGSLAQSAPFCPHVILLSVHPSERWYGRWGSKIITSGI
jgi:hypothetical protein